MLNELLEKFDLSADQALMVGDTEFDLDMAQQINMPRLAVSYGAHAKDRLLKYEPIACIDSFEGPKNGVDILSRSSSTICAGGLNFSVRNGKRWTSPQ